MVDKTGSELKSGVVFWLRMTIIMAITQINLCQAKATLEDYGYKGITILIERDVPEDEVLLKKLEESLAEASTVLFRATRFLVYFEEFIIVLPDTWTRKPHYGKADNYGNTQEKIVITSTKSEYGDAPYVKQPKECGQPGLFMHLTPSYITNDSVSAKWGPRGHTIVHEWAHLRWGLFDEYSIERETTRKENGNMNTARCPENATSTDELIEISPGVVKTKTVPYKNSSQMVSIMYTHYVRYVEFCGAFKDSAVRHNSKATNRQNTNCKKKSAWQVMREHSDFKDEKMSLPKENRRPIQFKYVQVQPTKIVLVLDTSSSMTIDDRLTRMNNAVSTMILTTLMPGTELGIVEFSTSAHLLSDLRTVTTEADRKNLISMLPTSPHGWTSIGAGLQMGLEVLHQGMDVPSGGTLIVISDGKENVEPLVSDIMPDVHNKSVVVHTISVTEMADAIMSNLSSSTGGQSFFDTASYNSTALIDSLAAIVTSGGLTHDPRVPLLLHTEAGSVSSGSLLTGEFYVDSTLGQNTTVSVSFTSPVNVTLTGPENIRISRHTHPHLYVTEVTGVLQIFLPDFVKNGTWFYNIIAIAKHSHVVVTVQSSSSEGENDVIRIVPWLPEENSLQFAPDRKVAIYAEVTRGQSSVLNSNVVAVIERPESGPLSIDLLDNGVGSDITKDDGIYSAYILAKDLSGDGRYGIKIKVEGVEGVTSVVVGGRGGSSGALEVDTLESTEELVTEELGRFQRVTSAGVFSVSGFPSGMTSIPDAIPPSRITDLRVSNDDTGDGAAELEWTSVGGDMDRGTATNYTFYFITDLDLIDSAGLNDSVWSEVSQTYLRDLRPPQSAGSRERVNISLDLLGENNILVLCVRATDDVGNAGELSNIVSVSRVLEPDVVTKVEDGDPGSRYYTLITVLPILVVTFLAVLLTCLILAAQRRQRKSFRVERNIETEGSGKYRVLYVAVNPVYTH